MRKPEGQDRKSFYNHLFFILPGGENMAYTNLQVSYAQDTSELTLVHLVGTEGQQIKHHVQEICSTSSVMELGKFIWAIQLLTQCGMDQISEKQQDTQIVLCFRSRKELEKEWKEDGDAVRMRTWG